MLREHGTQRPSVFELLTSVHRLRGTKSQFHYNIPVPQPLSPSHQQHHLKPYSSPSSTPSYRPSSSPSKSPNAGVQAREKVLEAIAPMRRGRPNIPDNHSYDNERSRSRPRSPQKAQAPVAKHKTKDWLDGDADGFDAAEEKAWKDISRTAGVSDGDAWNLSSNRSGKENEKGKPARGFGDDFAEKLWDSFDPNAQQSTSSPGSSTTKVSVTSIRPRPPAFTGTDIHSSPVLTSTPSYSPRGKDDKDKDAFAGLGFGTPAAPPTLAEARKLRTGLATAPSPASMNLGLNGHGYKSGSSASPRPTPSPRPPYLPPSQASASAGPPNSTGAASSSWKLPLPQPPQQVTSRSRPPSSAQLDAAESRFPSLEELDATFVGHGHGRSATSSETYSSRRQPLTSNQPPQLPERPPQLPSRNNNNHIGSGSGSSTTGGNSLRPAVNTYQQNGTRSQQVTGVAMRETDLRRGADDSSRSERERPKAAPEMPRRKETSAESSRPPLVRKHRSSVSVKHTPRPNLEDNQSFSPPKVDSGPTQGLATPRRRSPHDWLTGDDDFQSNDDTPTRATTTTLVSTSEVSTPVLRASPSKRASYIEQSSIPIQIASVAQRDIAPPSPQPPPSPSPTSTTSSYISRAARAFPPVQLDTTAAASNSEALTDNWSPVASTPNTNIVGKQKEIDSSSSADEGPEDAGAYVPRAPLKAEKPKRKGRQSSVHDLVDLWGGAGKEKEKERSSGTTFDSLIEVENHKPNTILPPISTNPNQQSYVPPSSSILSPKPVDRSTGNVSPKRPSHYESSSRKQPSPVRGGPTPSPGGRSRPQSMFLFPSSKSSNDGLPSGRGGLSPPTDDNSRPKNIRRTSISDMVQRYEAIGGKTSGTGAPPPNILPKPVALKVATQNTENGRYPLKVSSPITSRGNMNMNGVGRMLPIADEVPDTNTINLFGSEGASNRRSPTSGGFPSGLSPGLPRSSPLPNRASPSRTQRSNQQESARTAEADRGHSSNSSLEPPSSNYGFSARKSITTDDSSSRSGGGDTSVQGSPSPERPYQGVGKLIDQWQRKTAESEPPRVRVGSGFGAKRAGLISGGGGGGNK